MKKVYILLFAIFAITSLETFANNGACGDVNAANRNSTFKIDYRNEKNETVKPNNETNSTEKAKATTTDDKDSKKDKKNVVTKKKTQKKRI